MRHPLVLRTFKNNELSKKQNDCGISAERRIKNFDKKVTKVEFYSTKNRRKRDCGFNMNALKAIGITAR
ncbi:hypothetical protein CEQ28_016135 [Hafnia alvei]|nr:hypothetical protein CEQ28_016135 [Hafnia alvei]